MSALDLHTHISQHMQNWNCHWKFIEVVAKFDELLLIFRI